MATIIEMPKLSDTMTTGTLVRWLKKEGDPVSTGDMLAEIETDKATMELECFDDGVLLKQIVGEGQDVPVGAPIAAVGEKGEKIDEGSLKQQVKEKEQPEEEEEDKEATKEPEEKAEPEPKKAKGGEKKEREAAPAAGKSGPQASAGATSRTKPAAGERLRISPLARKLAKEKGLDVERLRGNGSGPGGRIVKADVLAALEHGTGGAPSVAGFVPAEGPIAEEKEISVSKMRGVIAQRLLESKTRIPHYYLETEVDAAPVLSIRASLNAALENIPPEQGGGKLSVNDFIIKACAEALRHVPDVNCSWQEDTIKQHPSAHVSFAVAIEEGLITPVIRDAQNKSLQSISLEAKELAGKAKNKKLMPEDYTGGTFCVSNLGMFGIDRFSAIINPPNAAILAVGSTRRVPVVNEHNTIEPGHRMSLTLSCDHRVVDGALGARFLTALRELLENPARLLL